MILKILIAVVLALSPCVRSTPNLNSAALKASNKSLAAVQLYDTCPWGYIDLSHKSSLMLDSSRTTTQNTKQVQCVGQYCNDYGARISSVRCNNSRIGSIIPEWKCSSRLNNNSYTLSSSEFRCSYAFSQSRCAKENSCAFRYTPTLSRGSGGGGGSHDDNWKIFVGLSVTMGVIFIIVVLYNCCRSMNRNVNTSGTTTTYFTGNVSPQNPPTLQTCPTDQFCTAVQVQQYGPPYPPAQPYPPAGVYPPSQPYPTATTYPIQQECPPPYIPTSPPFNPHYVSETPRGGLYEKN